MKTYLMVFAIALMFLNLSNAFARGSSHGSNKSYSSKSHSYSGSNNHAVRGHTRKDGTFVVPHHATNPNSTKRDNYSSRGNVNPYTGKPGTVDPDK
ncbi:MAG: hypothetical protein HY052_04090 [Proteobacteria bacterium]|nr:hypothetical protein [Pseudomonadota bacterium]